MAHHNKEEKPPKKNDLKIQMDNFMKMAAYMNKNTFSSMTTLPPEENRLYIGGNLAKNKGVLWKKEEQGDERTALASAGPERDQYLKDQMMNMREQPDAILLCKKCGQGTVL